MGEYRSAWKGVSAVAKGFFAEAHGSACRGNDFKGLAATRARKNPDSQLAEMFYPRA
jgi:hypothetical protein